MKLRENEEKMNRTFQMITLSDFLFLAARDKNKRVH